MRYLYTLMMLLAAGQVFGQVSAYSFSSSTGTFVPIKDSTTTIAMGGFLNGPERLPDDAASGSHTIPFAFRYNGVNYTTFGVTSNGFLKFGGTADGGNLTPLSTGVDNNVVSAFGRDLYLGFISTEISYNGNDNTINTRAPGGPPTPPAVDLRPFLSVGDSIYATNDPTPRNTNSNFRTVITAINGNSITVNPNTTTGGTAMVVDRLARPGYVRWMTQGVAPNRVVVVEWNTMGRMSGTTHYYNEVIQFQVRLYETTNVIEVVYGPNTGQATSLGVQVGLRGGSNADYNNRMRTTNGNWSTSAAGTSNSDAMPSGTGNTIPAGLTYRWTPPVCELRISSASGANRTVTFTDPSSFATNMTTLELCSGTTTASLYAGPGTTNPVNASWTSPFSALSANQITFNVIGASTTFNFTVGSGVCAGNYSNGGSGFAVNTGATPSYSLPTPTGAVTKPAGAGNDIALAVCSDAVGIVLAFNSINNANTVACPTCVPALASTAVSGTTFDVPLQTTGGTTTGATSIHTVTFTNASSQCFAKIAIELDKRAAPTASFNATVCEGVSSSAAVTLSNASACNISTPSPNPVNANSAITWGTMPTNINGTTSSLPIVDATNTSSSNQTTIFNFIATNVYSLTGASGPLSCASNPASTGTVVVKPAPVISISSPSGTDVTGQTVNTCRGTDRSLFASYDPTTVPSAPTYTWAYAGAANGVTPGTLAAGASVILNNTGQTANTLINLSGQVNGCTTTESVTLAVLNLATPTITGFTSGTRTQAGTAYPYITVCEGGSISLSAASCTNCQTYSWEYDPGTIANASTAPSAITSYAAVTPTPYTGPNYNHSPSFTRFWALRGTTSGNGCEYKSVFVVSIMPNPSIVSVVPSKNDVCAGESVTVTANVSSTPGRDYSYNWNPSAIDSNVVQASLNTPTTTGRFEVTVTDDLGCRSTSTTAAITVNDGAVVTFLSASPRICIGSSTVVNAGSNTGSSFSWSRQINSGPITPLAATTDTLSDNYSISATNSDLITYSLTVSNPSNPACKDTQSIVVRLDSCSTPSIVGVGKQVFCAGEIATLEVQGVDTTRKKIIWSNGATTKQISVLATQGTIYSVVVGNYVTTTDSTIIFPSPIYAAGIQATSSATVPSARDACESLAPCDSARYYTWNTAASLGTQCGCIPNPVRTYQVITSFVPEPDGRDSFTITIATPSINLTVSNDTVCAREQIISTLSYNDNNAPSTISYLWEKETNPSAFVVAANTLTVASSVTTASTNSAPITINRDTVLYVSAKNSANCIAVDSFTIVSKVVPTIVLPDSLRLCAGSTGIIVAQAIGNCNACSYLWNTGETTQIINISNAGRYILSVESNSCIVQDTSVVTITTPSTPEIDTITNLSGVPPLQVPLCVGDSVRLYFRSHLMPYRHYTYWNNGATDTSILVTSPGGYYLQAIDSITGCKALSNPIMVVAAATGYNTIATANPSRICGTSPASISVPPCVGCSYRWYDNNNITASLPSSSSRVFSTITPSGYFAVVTNMQGCAYPSSVATIVSDSFTNPVVTATATSVCNQGSSITFATPANAGFGYQWFASRSGGPRTIISAATSNTYTETFNFIGASTNVYNLRVTYPNGCTAISNSITVSIGSNFTVTSPNNATVCAGDSTPLATTNDPAYAYQWYRNGTAILGATASVVYAQQAGQYHAYVTNADGCAVVTQPAQVSVAASSAATATATRNNICAGDTVTLYVSVCVGCRYRWYRNGAPIDASFSNANFSKRVGQTGNYYAIVETATGGCLTTSNTVSINLQNVIVPSIISNSTEYCNGISPILRTSNCAGCSYTWIRNGQPIYGALNDTFYAVIDTGNYRVAVLYPSGCSDTSAQQIIITGGYQVTLTETNNGIVCNGAPITLTAGVNPSNKCSGGCVYRWFRNGSLINVTTINNITADSAGFYRVQVTSSSGCVQDSEVDTIQQIQLSPIIQGTASSICGSNPIGLSVPPCVGCSYQWSNSTTTIPSSNTPSITVTQASGYTVSVSVGSTCGAVSPPYTLNPLASLAPIVQVLPSGSTVTGSSCAGNGASLSLQTLCASCTYQWMMDSFPAYNLAGLRFIPGATLPTYSAVRAGGYAIVLRDTATNCLDTSNIVSITPVAPAAGFGLNFSPNSLASSGAPIDLDVFNGGLTPASLHTQGQYSISPLFAYNPATVTNPGLSISARRDTFSPTLALPGNYQVNYSYTASGCTFTTNSLLRILDAATVNIVNTNPQSISYEACVGDTLLVNTSNYAFSVTDVSIFNQQDAYTTVSAISNSVTPTNYGGSIVYAQQIRFVVPDIGKGSFVRLTGNRSGGALDTALTPFLLIHNEPLSFSGLPQTICSNGNPIGLVGTPVGGSFVLQAYNSQNASLDTSRIAGAFVGTTLNPGAIPVAQYDSLGIDTMRVVYQYTSTYSNGNACPYPDTSTQLVVARAVNLTAVRFNNISVSQPRERIENLVARVVPHAASPARWLRDTFVRQPVQQHAVRYGGSFTAPAGNPEEFLPANAGVGVHTLTYSIVNGPCINTVSDNITVLPAPSVLPLGDTICRNILPVDFGRDAAYSYRGNLPVALGGGVTYRDTFNIMAVRTRDSVGLNNRYLDTINGNAGLEAFRYTPRDASATIPQLGRDSILIEYIYRRVEYNGAVPFDTVQYVIGSYFQRVVIEDTVAVDIPVAALSRVYCEDNTDNLVVGTPSGGVFSLVGGTGAYATAQPLANNILNSFQIHQNETANTDYVLIYTLNGVACRSRDTFRFKIPEPISPAFSTASGRDAYCNSALPDTIRTNPAAAGSILLVNGVSQPRVGGHLFFTPTLTTPGQQLVIHQVTDSFGCVTEARDTFEVYPLPNVRLDSFAGTEFCTNDSSFRFYALPSPICVGATGGELMREGFDLPQLPLGWDFSNLNPASAGWGQRYVNGYGVAFVDTVSQPQNTWMYTRNIPMVAGGTYLIEYWLRVGPRNCPTCADAAMEVTVGQGQNVGAQTTILANYPSMDDNYAGFYTLQSHSFIAPSNGNYNFAFHAYSAGRTTRWISLDTVIVRQISAANCQAGIGSISGAGFSNVPGNDSAFIYNPRSVAPGNYTIRYTYSDVRGCVDSAVLPIVVKAHPTVTMASLDPTYCNNAPAVPLSGMPAGGVFADIRTVGTDSLNMTLLGMSIDTVAYNTSVDLRFTPRRLGTEVISYRYRDPLTQCATTIFDTVSVVGIPDSAEIISLDTAYCEGAVPAVLDVAAVAPRGLPAAGYFFGPGVLNGAAGPGAAQWKADSAVAVQGRVGNATITYVYTASNGCVDTTRFTTRVQGRLNLSFDLVADSVRLPDSICLNDPNKFIRVRHQQLIGVMGNILVDTTIAFNQGVMTSSSAGLGLGDLLQPSVMGAGWHHISYYFRNPDVPNCEATINDSVRVDTVPVVYFAGLPPSKSYCENEPGSLLLANPPYYPGSGFLRFTNTINTDTIIVDSSFYYIDPALMADSNVAAIRYNVFYSFRNLRGCTSTGTDTFQIRSFPRITFGMDSVYCNQDSLLDLFANGLVSPIGGVFTDNLPVTSIIDTHYLDLNSAAGPRRISYVYTNPLGCTASRYKDVTLYHTPEIGFEAIGGCEGQAINFVPSLGNFNPAFDSITRIVWNFGDGSPALTVTPASGSVLPSQSYTYSSNGFLNPTMTAFNQGFCAVTVGNPLLISPLVVLDRYAAPYVEDFQISAGGWFAKQSQFATGDTLNQDTTWSHSELLNGAIVDAGNKAWVTHANDDNVYGLRESGEVYSPCFDFTRTWKPMISLDVWRDATVGIDGAVLEFYNPNSNAWESVGEMSKGQNWYQSDFLLARPGNQRSATNPTGWTGESRNWENARYRLDQFAGRNNVRFRIAFATTANTVLVDQPQGFAFDSVWIGERGRNVLIEHFTNYAYPDVYTVDQGLYDQIFTNYNGRDFNLIQYHTQISALDDQNNLANEPDVSARSLFYGIQEFDNRALVDGTPRGDGTTSGLNIDSIDLDLLQFPAFNIFVDPLSINTATGEVTVTATFQALKPMPADDYRMYAVIVEDSIPNQLVTPNSSPYYLMGVMRKMLPSPAGENYSGAWWQGQNKSFSSSYFMNTSLPNPTSLLSAVVFIQNGNQSNPDVYQVATTRDLTIYAFDSLTSVVPLQGNFDKETATAVLYPNPAVDYFTVKFDTELNMDYQWQVVDILGQVLQTGNANAGTTQIEVNTNDYPAGSYFFVIGNERVRTQRQVIIQRP